VEMKDSKKDVIMWLIVLSICVMVATVLIGIALDTVLTDIRNLKDNQIYWLRNQVADLQNNINLIESRQECQMSWQTKVYIDFRDSFKEIAENTRKKTFDELIEEAMSEENE